MKLQLFSLFISSLFYLSKCQDLIKSTNYTVDYLNNLDSSKITCQKDSDCPEFSTCVKNKDNSTISTCKFGNFLYFKIMEDKLSEGANINEYCSYVNTDLYDMDKEKIIKKDVENAPILKTCPVQKSRGKGSCRTDRCKKNEDCFSGLCDSNYCSNDIFYVYRCTGTDLNVKCGKQKFMKCNSDEECYSGVCSGQNKCINKRISFFEIIGYGVLAILFLIVIMIIIYYGGALIKRGFGKLFG